jgi:hypothetical protein
MPNSARQRDMFYLIAKQTLKCEARSEIYVETAVMFGEFDAGAVVFNHLLHYETRVRKYRPRGEKCAEPG